LELDHRLDPEQGFADIRRFIIGTIRQHVPVGDSIAKEIEVSPFGKVADVHSGPEVQVCVQLEYLVHSIQTEGGRDRDK
jgi:hypothetical protein